MKTPVSRIAPGKFILYRGEPCIVLEHRKEDTLLAVAKQIERSFGKTNNFNDEDNALQVHLNSVYLDTLTQGNPDEIITRTVDLIALIDHICRFIEVQIAVLDDKPVSILPLNSWQLIYGDIRNCNSHVRLLPPL